MPTRKTILLGVLLVFSVVVATYTLAHVITTNSERSKANTERTKNLVRERNERIDQDCAVLENQQRRDVETLRGTYDYLRGLTKEQMKEPLNQAVTAGIGRAEREAYVNDAPAYCAKPGVGLEGPPPKVPPRPDFLKPPVPLGR